MFAHVEELSAHPADAAELFDIENRDRAAGECDDAVFLERLKVRETTSLALPRFRAICSCVVESTGEPVRMRSSSRYPARRWSSRVKRSWPIAHMTSEKCSVVSR